MCIRDSIIVDTGRLLVDRFGVQTLVEHARLVFAQLAKYFSSCNVDGSEEALFVLFDANDMTPVSYTHLVRLTDQGKHHMRARQAQ